MSHDLIEERVGKLELGQARQETRLERIEVDLSKVGMGVEKLLEREAKRPEPTTWKNVAGTLGATFTVIGALAVFVWWFIAASPVVLDLDRRLTRLDDPDVGRVTRVEKEIGWTARVRRDN
jgi:hypothetical protein